jgi:hypothetical protein
MLTVPAYGCASYPPLEPLTPLARRFLHFFDDAGSLHRVDAMFASLASPRIFLSSSSLSFQFIKL